MKKKRNECFPFWGSGLKLLRVMKLITFFLLAGFLQVSANIYSQTANIKLDIKTSSMNDVIQKIQKQTDFVFFYSPDDIDGIEVSNIELEGATLEETLEICLKNTSLSYEIKHNAVVIRPAPKADDSALTGQAGQGGKKVRGTVVSVGGDPIPGAAVIIKGTTIGTVTDPDGNYNLTKVPENIILVFSFVGMKSQEIPYSGQEIINVTMEETTTGIDEVVVVGYGVQKKISVTGAVSSIETKDVVQSSSASLANALAGRMPGLTSIQSGGGQPGRDDATMYLRGAATTNGTQPLILIDGVPRDNIRTIDPNEVASVSILKDASATALFGVRGANGVIMITTKRGEKGKMELVINATQSFTSFTQEPERLHSLEYLALRNEASINDGNEAPYDDVTISRYANPLEGLDPNDPDYEEQARILNYMYPDHDYYREYISKNTPQTRINLGARGGTEQLSYYVDVAFLHQGGNLDTEPESFLGYDPSSWMNRYNFRANLDYQLSESLKAFLNIGSYIEKVNMPAAWVYPGNDTNWMMRDLIYQAQTILPITPGPTTIDGFGVEPGQIVDPGYMDRSAFEIMNRMGYRNEVRSNLNTTFGVEWDLSKIVTKGLSLKGMISYDSKATSARQGEKRERLYLANVNAETNEMNYAVKRSDESLLSIVKGSDSRYNINLQGSINYNRTFGEKHEVGGMILAQRDYWETTAGEIPYNMVGFAGRFTYAYDQRYLGEINMGYNGSEQFSPDKRFGFFPAVSVGWVMSNERFMKENKIITNLKLRASYGKVGNDKMGNARFLYQDNISMGGGPLGSLGKGQGINQGLLGNRDLTWEEAKKQNYGIDMQFFNDLNITFDYFIEKRDKILISRGMVPEFQGVALGNVPKVNMGKVDNKGFEVEITYNKVLAKELLLSFRGNYGYNRNKIKYYDEPIRDETYAYRYRNTGYSLRQPWGYKIDYSNGNGYFNSEEELNDYLGTTIYGFGSPRVGDFKYIDMNKDGVINDKDQAPIGYPTIPRVTYGLTLNLTYKDFDFTAFFQGVGKYGSNYAGQGVYEYIKEGTYFGYHKHAWTADRNANGDKITYPALSTHSNTNHVANDYFIMDRSFLRLKNIELGYTLPKGTLSKLGISNLRVFVSGQNLFTWDNLEMDHLDPENDDTIGYPVTKMKNFGLDITF